jgi:hypothetical protein
MGSYMTVIDVLIYNIIYMPPFKTKDENDIM